MLNFLLFKTMPVPTAIKLKWMHTKTVKFDDVGIQPVCTENKETPLLFRQDHYNPNAANCNELIQNSNAIGPFNSH